MAMTKVYVVQEPGFRVGADGTKEHKINLDPARKFGEIEFLLESGLDPGTAMQPYVRVIKKKLEGMKPDDLLLPLGDPAIMAIAVAIAAQQNSGKVSVLRWDRFEKDYQKISVSI